MFISTFCDKSFFFFLCCLSLHFRCRVLRFSDDYKINNMFLYDKNSNQATEFKITYFTTQKSIVFYVPIAFGV